MSELAKRLTGTLIENEYTARPAVCQWLQTELKTGRLRRAVAQFAAQQPESLDVDFIQVEEVHPDRLVCLLPCFLVDHESTHPFRSEVVFELNPLTGQTLRR